MPPKTGLEKLLAYVQVMKQQAAVAGHQGHSGEDDAYHMGSSAAYQDVERVLTAKIGQLTAARQKGRKAVMCTITVNYTLSSEFRADVEYEDLAAAIAADIEGGTGDFTEVPSLEQLSVMHAPLLGKSAGNSLDELLTGSGYEIDSSAAVVDSMLDES